MNSLLPALLGATLLLFASVRSAPAEPELKAWLGSAFIVPGEETQLVLAILSDTRPDSVPRVPKVPDLTIQFKSDHLVPEENRKLIYLYRYTIRSYAEGTHTIPAFESSINGKTIRSQPTELHVAALRAENWQDHRLLGEDFRFASAVFVPPAPPYEGETIPAEAKVYLPARMIPTKATLADLEYDGLVAWRFEGSYYPWPIERSRISSGPRPFSTNVRIEGSDYVGVVFTSTLAPLRSNEISLGPGKAFIRIGMSTLSQGMIKPEVVDASLPIPKRTLKTKPLPPNPPPGFDKAVGRFTLSAIADTKGLKEGDPISVRLSVAGIGNLDSLPPPQLEADPGEWKVYPSSRLARQGERRDVSGVVTFSQIVRPLVSQKEIPPFRLVSFNPATEQYETQRTLPIPFQVASASRTTSGPLQVLPNLGTPVEQMEGILGLVDPTRGATSPSSTGIWRYWQLLPALAGLLLLLRLAQLHLLPRLRRPPTDQDLVAALSTVAQAGPSPRDFLRAVGHFIEAWIPRERRDEEVESLLSRRDLEAYRPDVTGGALEGEERRQILEQLRSRTLRAFPLGGLLALLMTGATPPLEAASIPAANGLYQQADAAWAEGSYRAALEFYRTAHPDRSYPPDVLFNLGNCYFQLGETGRAALHYHRALLANPTHVEARQNLGFLKRKTGAITVELSGHQKFLSRIGRERLSSVRAAGLWITGLGLLALFAALTKPLRLLSWLGVSVGPVIATSAIVGLALHPSEARFAPADQRAVVVAPEALQARTEASSMGAKVIDVPPGSLCRPLARRGNWIYIELPNRTRGWIPAKSVELLIPGPKLDLPSSETLGA